MYSDCNIRIRRLQNGYNVSITDPKIVKQNQERDKSSDCCAPWQDPEVSYAFSTSKEVIDFLTKNIDKALPVDEYSSTFDQAAKEATDD